MAKNIDLDALHQAVAEAAKLDEVRAQLAELQKAVDHVNKVHTQLQEILTGVAPKKRGRPAGRKTAGKKSMKLPHPVAGSAPARLCEVVGSTPKPVDHIAKETGLTAGTIKSYIQKFDCFQNVRGQGYIHKEHAGGGASKSKKTVKKRAAKKKSPKKKTTKKKTKNTAKKTS